MAFCRLTTRTERGVGLRPPTPERKSGLGPALGPDSVYIPATDEWTVERGAGPGGRLGSQLGYPSELDEGTAGGD